MQTTLPAKSTQINFRIPSTVKMSAQRKAESIGIPLNVLVKQFLFQFAQKEDIVQYQISYDFDTIFDAARKEGLSSDIGTQAILSMNKIVHQYV